MDVVDLSAGACDLGREVCTQLSLPVEITFHHADAADFDAVADSDIVILAALVGVDGPAKRAVLAAVSERMRPGDLLVARTLQGLRTLLYPPVDLLELTDEWRPLALVHPFTEVVNSVLVAVRR